MVYVSFLHLSKNITVHNMYRRLWLPGKYRLIAYSHKFPQAMADYQEGYFIFVR